MAMVTSTRWIVSVRTSANALRDLGAISAPRRAVVTQFKVVRIRRTIDELGLASLDVRLLRGGAPVMLHGSSRHGIYVLCRFEV
jgi:hypothetical protein